MPRNVFAGAADSGTWCGKWYNSRMGGELMAIGGMKVVDLFGKEQF
jgi:hypothetical protein